MNFRHTITATVLGLAATLAQAQGPEAAYPTRAIKMVVPLSAGTTTDLVARRFAERISKQLGQNVVVDNRPGAGGTIAAQGVAKAEPDGYTILLVNSQHAINPTANSTLPYDTLRDFAGIALVGEAPSVIAVSRDLGVSTLAEFVALAKREPMKINYGSSGVGSQTHLAGAYFASRAGISLTHVPYRSAPDVLSDLVANRIQATFVPAAFVLPQIQEGRLRALAVSGRERLDLMRDVPTVSESAIPGYEFSTWFGFIAPAKTPAHIVTALAQAFQLAVDDPKIRKYLIEQGVTARMMPPREFDAYIRSEIDRLRPIVKSSGVREN